MTAVVSPLDARGLVAPLLPSLPGAAMASEPASAVLPLLSPILRQRVQFLSASSSEPWIRLLSYDAGKAARLVEIARSHRLEPHPISGEIEIDWDDSNVEIRYKRLDVETLQALVLLRDLGLVFRLVHCEGDHEGDRSGWRIGEVSIPDAPHAFAAFGGWPSVAEAERVFEEATKQQTGSGALASSHFDSGIDNADDEDDDDDYWARYDATPARTPAVKRSPAPASVRSAAAPAHVVHGQTSHRSAEAEDAYFAQYDSVQPAMDNHDPDEVHDQATIPPPLGMGAANGHSHHGHHGHHGHHHHHPHHPHHNHDADDEERLANMLHHPRPASASSNSSSGSAALVAKLEHSAGKQEQGEFGVKQHVSRSIKSLYMLSRASSIDREEFAQLVKTELDMLAMMDD